MTDTFRIRARSSGPSRRADVILTPIGSWVEVELPYTVEGNERALLLVQDPAITVETWFGDQWAEAPSVEKIKHLIEHLRERDAEITDVTFDKDAQPEADKSDPVFQAGYTAGFADGRDSEAETVAAQKVQLDECAVKISDLLASLDAEKSKVIDLTSALQESNVVVTSLTDQLSEAQDKIDDLTHQLNNPPAKEQAEETQTDDAEAAAEREAAPAAAEKPRKGK